MTLVSHWVAETLDHLLGSTAEEIDVLAAPIANNATTLTVTYGAPGIQEGATLAVDLEEFRVPTPPSGTSVPVIGGANGTTRAAHTAGALVKVNPPFSPPRIVRALNASLRELHGRGIYRMATADVTFDAAFEGYPLPTAVGQIEDIYEVRVENYGSARDWPRLSRSSWDVDRHMPVADFTGGLALFLTGGLSGQTARVVYKSAFTPVEALGDDVEDVTGLHDSAHDLVPIAAAIRLVAGREVRRNLLEIEGSPRRGEDVPAGAANASTASLRALLRERVAEERNVLSARYPMVRR